MYKGDLVLKEILYGGRSSKYAYEVIEDKLKLSMKNTIKSLGVLRLLIKGYSIEMVDDNNKSLYILRKECIKWTQKY